MPSHLAWKKTESNAANGEFAYLGQIAVASVTANIANRSEYLGSIWLPSINPSKQRVTGRSAEEVKAAIEPIVDAWIKAAGLTPAP